MVYRYAMLMMQYYQIVGFMKKLPKYKTFIFDWDGTVNQLNVLYKLNRTMNPYWLYRKSLSFNNSGPKKPSNSEIKLLMHKAYIRERDSLREEENLILAKMVDFLHMFVKPRLSYGAKAVLNSLKNKGVYIAVFSDGSVDRVIREARYLRVYKYIDVILSAQSIHKIKPDPTGVGVILAVSGSKPKSTLMVGDMCDDIMTAKNARIDSCAVCSGISSIERLKMCKPNYLFKNMEELKRYI